MKKYLTILFVVVFVLTLSTSFALAENKKPKIAPQKEVDYAFDPTIAESIACSQEAKLCDDGSSVGRKGPNCEFAKCPNDDLRDKNTDDRFMERDNGMLRKETEKDNVKSVEREKIKAQIEVLREEAKGKMEALREKLKGEKDKVKAKIIETRITGREEALKRFDAAIARLSTLKDTVNEKITKFEAKGINVENAKTQLEIADTKITEAKAKVVEANTLLSKSLTQLTKEDKAKLRQLAQETQSLLREAHLALNESIKSLKEGLQNKIKEIKPVDDQEETANTDSAIGEVKE